MAHYPYIFPVDLYLGPQAEDTSSNPGSYLLTINGSNIRLTQIKTPSAHDDTGFQGEICYDQNYMYVHNGQRWTRIALDKTDF